MKLRLLPLCPVSYTHLDVYKRQEQVIQIFQDLAGYTLGQAEMCIRDRCYDGCPGRDGARGPHPSEKEGRT